MARVLLFDIDNTLLWSGGAGGKAMKQAFAELFGIADGFARVEFSGRTDTAIFRDALRLHSIDRDYAQLLARFSARYHQLLPASLRDTEGRLMPGIPQLLDALQERDGARLGLATGNFRQGAFLKLRHFDIDGYFRDGAPTGRGTPSVSSGAPRNLRGAFGDDDEDRDALVQLAIRRVAGRSRPADVLVIGDTPLDIAAARANDAVAVAVATGKHSADELKAVGADFVFPDFSDWRGALAVLLG